MIAYLTSLINDIDNKVNVQECFVSLEQINVSTLIEPYRVDPALDNVLPPDEQSLSESDIVQNIEINTMVVDTQDKKRRGSRKRVPNHRYATDYVPSVIQRSTQNVTSPKRSLPSPVKSTNLASKPPVSTTSPSSKRKTISDSRYSEVEVATISHGRYHS